MTMSTRSAVFWAGTTTLCASATVTLDNNWCQAPVRKNKKKKN
jgi:hypothetical protein